MKISTNITLLDKLLEKRTYYFSERKQLKKLFIPLLLVLKLFKLKLLLFLPLILGLASFKKFLGFLALIIPGAIAFFNFCKPSFQQGGKIYQDNLSFWVLLITRVLEVRGADYLNRHRPYYLMLTTNRRKYSVRHSAPSKKLKYIVS
nr:unnamed protein product [Callosobruchus chinensis]